MSQSPRSVARFVALGTIVALAACQDASQPTSPVVPSPQASRSPQAQARLEALFQRTSPEVMALPGTVFADNDEVAGRLVFGVENAAAMTGARNALARLGVDESDYAFELTQPIVPMALGATLRDASRPTVAGLQIHFSRYLCSIGFNADEDGVPSMYTASHCTATQGGIESTLYYQPTSSSSEVIATEAEDPIYTKGSDCPRGKKCRYSDAARATYTAGVQSSHAIARTTGVNNGSLTIDVNTPTFSVTSQDDGTTNFAIKTPINKVGRTTGWTRGVVTRSCVNTSVSGSTVYLLCQTFVSDPNGATVVGGGDSGSGVFGDPSGNGVQLLGILWGGSSDNKTFVFSPLASVEKELGALNAK